MSKTLDAPVRHLPLVAFSDRELLHVIADNLNPDGWILGRTIADVLEVSYHSVGSRLAWLVRYGVLERKRDVARGKEKKAIAASAPPLYRMTALGLSIYEAALTREQEKTLTSLVNGRGVAAIGALMNTKTDPASALMTRREFRFWDAKRPGGPKR